MISSKASTAVLVADDEANDVFLLRRAFQKAGLSCDLRVVSDGEEAISYLHGDGQFQDRCEHPLPQILLLDLKMPRKNGLEVLAWVRQQSNGLRRLPIIVMSSSNEDVDVNRAYELGVNSYLVKPSNFEDLVEMVRTISRYWFDFSRPPGVQSESSLQSE